MDKIHQQLEKEKEELEDERSEFNYMKNNYQDIISKEYEHKFAQKMEKVEIEKTNQRLQAQAERNKIRKE